MSFVGFFPSPSTRAAVLTGCALAGLILAWAACDSGAECVLDSDCPLGRRCNAANRCVERTSAPDTGATNPDASNPIDAGGGADVPIVLDAPPGADAGRDVSADAPDDCPVLASSYTVSRVGVGCRTRAMVVTFTRLPGECAYDVASDERGEFTGTMRREGTGFSGGLVIDGAGRICSLDVFPAAVAVTCGGGCSIDLVAP